jgi:hypothetical protein
MTKFSAVFFLNFWSSKPSRLDSEPDPCPDPDSLEMLDPDSLEMLDPVSMNLDPQHCSSPTTESALLYGKPVLFSLPP